MALRKNTIQHKSTSKLGTSPMRNSISTRGLNDRQFEQMRELQQAQQELLANQSQIQQLDQQLLQAKQIIQKLQSEGQAPKVNQVDNSKLKEELVGQITNFEQLIAKRMAQLNKRLQEREEELDSVKRLFVEKLRALESNFAEIGDHLVASQVHQQRQAEQEKSHGQNIIRQVLDDVHKDSKENDEKAFEELVQTNANLHDQINELKKQYKDFVDAEKYAQAEEELKGMREQSLITNKANANLSKLCEQMKKEKEAALEDQSRMKQEKQIMQVELSKMKESVQSSRLEKDEQQMIIEQSLKEI